MRLILIIVFGGILIGATYAWSSTLKQDDASASDLAFEQKYVRKTTSRTTVTTTKSSPGMIASTPAVVAQVATPGTAESETSIKTSSQVTSIDSARERARASAGKPDPFAPIEGAMPFPRSGGSTVETQVTKTTTAKKVAPLELVPPPPSGSGIGADFGAMPGPHNGFVPPPPAGTGMATGLSMDDLPQPPDKPGVARLLKLSAIIGDKAVFQARDLYTRRMQKWPAQITLSPGDYFGTLKLISTKPESALVEEHGETIEIELPPVR